MDIEFTEAEIQQELAALGYNNVPAERLKDFKQDLHRLLEQQRSKNLSISSTSSDHQLGATRGPVLIDKHPTESLQYKTIAPNFMSEEYGKENMLGGAADSQSAHRDLPAGHYSLYDRPASADIPDDVSECGSERRMVKRKVLRRNGEGSKFIDESMTESDAGSIIDANECMKRLALRDSDDLALIRRPRSSRDDVPYRLAPDDPRPSSVILRQADHPHTRNLRKSDPVARFQQFQQVWQVQKAPGEKDRKGLRWNIREQMLSQDTFEKKAPKVYIANEYKVPTEKKRSALRWQIRTDMAQGNMPPCGMFYEY